MDNQLRGQLTPGLIMGRRFCTVPPCHIQASLNPRSHTPTSIADVRLLVASLLAIGRAEEGGVL